MSSRDFCKKKLLAIFKKYQKIAQSFSLYTKRGSLFSNQDILCQYVIERQGLAMDIHLMESSLLYDWTEKTA
jgi:hypothetical protein